MAKTELMKIEKNWVILITHEDGTNSDYRFGTKREALDWAKVAGLNF